MAFLEPSEARAHLALTPSFQADRPSSPARSVVLNDPAPSGHKPGTLERDEEQALARAWRAQGDTAARNRLIEAHLDAVRSLAHKYISPRATLEDLVSVGRLGLLRACETFEPDRGLRFMTYASFWVRAEMLSYTWSNRSIVPAARSKLQRRIHPLRHERSRLLHELGDADQVDERLAAEAGVSVDTFRQQISEWSRRDMALDETPAQSGGSHLDNLADSAPNSEALLLDQERKNAQEAAIRSALSALDKRERFIVEAHLMANSEDEMSLSELGALLGVSRERVRQLELRAKRKIVSHLKRSPEPAELLFAS